MSVYQGADNIIVIWRSTGQGILKYTHSSPIQTIKFNPSKLLLVSCSDNDFGFWSPDQKQVAKEKVPSRILSVAWTSDGENLALGMQSGVISIRNSKSEVRYGTLFYT
jgi:intraflagellar transport protein 122